VIYRITLSVLLALSCALWAGNNHQGETLPIPEPEDVYEALQSGLIDYDDFQRLLEIAETGRLTAQDSVYLLGFPDLLFSLSGNPLIDQADSISADKNKSTGRSDGNRQTALFRQSYQLDPDGGLSQLCRIQSDYGRWSFAGQMGKDVSGGMQWKRRQVAYRITDDAKQQSTLILGNFSEQFGLGVVYGYHGLFLHKPTDRATDQEFLFPKYGGSNGAALTLARNGGEVKAIIDIDRADSVEERFFGISLPWNLSFTEIQASVAYGKLRQRLTGASAEAAFFSLTGKSFTDKYDLKYEGALARQSQQSSYAAAVTAAWKGDGVMVRANGWHYEADYPSWFAGGPSARRYQNSNLDELDFSYRNRFSGETGALVKSDFKVGSATTLQTAAGYSRRDVDNNRAEAKVAVKQMIGRGYHGGLQFYWRGEDMGADSGRQDRALGELVRDINKVKIRLAASYRFDRNGGRNDWLMLMETKATVRTGVWQTLIKVDRLRWSDLRNQYLYLVFGHESPVGNNLKSAVRYVYRYSRGGDSYGTIRWEVRWDI
jgi:hypothetical protein